MINVSQKDREILRRLAGRFRELSESRDNNEKRKLWYKHNSLDPEKPLIVAFPEGAWEELVKDSDLQCENPLLRQWEKRLRQDIYTMETIKDDQAFETCFNIGWQVSIGNYGVDVKYTYGEHRGSYVWDYPIKDLDRDFEKLKFRELSVDRELTYEYVKIAESIFGDLLPVRIRGIHWWSLGLTNDVIALIGLENLMMYMYDNPEGIHRIMAWMRDEHLHFIEWLEKEGLLTHMNLNDYTGSGGSGYTNELPKSGRSLNEPAMLKDLWGFAESQETVGVSPQMFGEFIFPYQLPILQKFGLNCYGCCEGVERRIEYIMQIPNIRRVSVSPWADQNIMAERLGKNCIFSRKPNPAMICVSFNEDVIREDIRNTLNIAGKGVLEIIMKDTHTVENEPWRISRWVEIAKEEAAKYMDGK